MKKILSTIMLTMFGAMMMMAQMQMPSIPVDPDVRIGKLDNGNTLRATNCCAGAKALV